MARITIEFDGVNQKLVDSVISMLNGKPGTKKVAKEEEEEAAEEDTPEEDDDLTGGEDDEAQPTLELLKETAQKLIAAGKSAKLKEVLKTFKAAKVVDVDKKKYADFLAAMKKIK